MHKNHICFCPVKQFELSACHIEGVVKEYPESHIHNQCEIYVNLSGNVSFMVEGKLYPVQRGSVIITRPFEYHHCIYHDFSPHEHFWILFSCAGNENLLEPFFNRPAGTGNLINLPERYSETLFEICHALAHNKNESQARYYQNFFNLLSLLDTGVGDKSQMQNLPVELQHVLRVINRDFSSPVSVDKLAQDAFISINTLERMFKKYIGLTPAEYIRKKRLSHSAKLLQQGHTVSETALLCGFNDVSRFISLFKKEFSQTPLQYKKRNTVIN